MVQNLRAINNFQFQPGLKKIGVTRDFTSFYPGVKIFLQRLVALFVKTFYRKSMFRMQLEDYIKTMMSDFQQEKKNA